MLIGGVGGSEERIGREHAEDLSNRYGWCVWIKNERSSNKRQKCWRGILIKKERANIDEVSSLSWQEIQFKFLGASKIYAH
jgi:hypothetical protein